MVRIISQLLGLLALLLAPLPAAAAAPPATAAVAVASEHCDEADSGSSHRNADEQQGEAKHPCCKNSMSSCCPVVAPPATSGSLDRSERAKSNHRARPEIFVLGTSGPPLTQPPTFA